MARIKSSEMPGFIKPQLATLKAKAPAGKQWLHEIKFDGYRVQIHLNKGKRKRRPQATALSS
jgi:bifunctional non-homologous end joining protein LigD